ncbi:MAG: TadE/TadG family type IV pilus assembly protein [Candidatus Limnocylindria bacterium]
MSVPFGRPRGQSLVEFALILPILLILLLGLLDFGRAVSAYNSVSNGARSGARVAIVNQNEDDITAAVESEVGLPEVEVDFDFNVESEPLCPRIGCLIEVSVSTQYTPATPIIGNLVGTLTVSSSSRMAIERAYVSP